MPTRTCLAVVLCLGVAPALRADPAELVGPPPPVPRLVEQLGSPDFPKRDRASRLLRGLGPGALPELRAARDHAADPEVTADRQEPAGDPVGIGQGVPQVGLVGEVCGLALVPRR